MVALRGRSGCKKIQSFIDKLISSVLNDKSTVSRVYRKMDVPRLLTALCDSKHNILAVGQGQSWMLNALSVDKQHVVGTRIMYGYESKMSNYDNWWRLQAFAKQYAAPGAQIKVCCLPYQEGSEKG